MNSGSDTVLSKNPNFMNFGMLPTNTPDKLRSGIVPTTRVGRPTNVFNWIRPRHDIEESTADRVIKMKQKNHYNYKNDFETMREIQYFEREDISMSQPTLDSTPIVKNTTNRTTSLMDSIKVGTKTPDPMPLTKPTEFPEKNGRAHVPNDPDPDPSLSDSSLKKNKCDKKKNRRKHRKDDSSDPSSSDDSDSSYDSDYRRKRRKRKIHKKWIRSNYAHV